MKFYNIFYNRSHIQISSELLSITMVTARSTQPEARLEVFNKKSVILVIDNRQWKRVPLLGQ